MDENAIKAVRRGVLRGLSQYLVAEDDPPIELQLLLHRLQKEEGEPKGPVAPVGGSKDDGRE